MLTYPIVETFYSIQGEGLFSGASAYFVRLFGCPVKCPWCDTKKSWLNDKPSFDLSATEIANQASLSNCEFAVITGGEPTIHPLQELIDAFHNLDIKVHLETSGYVPKNIEVDWITLSPKLHSHTHESYLEVADELKFIVSNEEEISLYFEKFGEYLEAKKAVFITPEFSKSADKELLNAICETVKLYGEPLRAGWQLHKNFGAL